MPDVTPLSFDKVSLPGIKEPPRVSSFDFVLKPGEPRIFRVAFHGDFPIRKTSTLSFRFCSPTSPLLRPDIVRGDIGFPSVHLQNADGAVYRFARGNMKDFFDIAHPNRAQRIDLPVAWFNFDTDLKSNVPPTGDFFDAPITKLYFDFLRHPEQPIDIHLSEIGIFESGTESELAVSDLVFFDRADQASALPRFSTERPEMGFRLTLTNVAFYLGYTALDLELTLRRGEHAFDTQTLTLMTEAIYAKVAFPARGCFTLVARLSHGGETVARSEWDVCHVMPRDGRPPSHVMGISDGRDYDRIAASGGTWDRLPIVLQSIMRTQKEGGFRFHLSSDMLPRTLRKPGQCRVVAPFWMPKWLSRHGDRPDFLRYGAADWDAYGDLVAWLARQAAEAGYSHYETWNEITALGHWADDLDNTLRLHETTYAAVKGAVPEMQVLGGCTHSWTFDYLRDFLAAGGAEQCDGLAMHGYTYQPEDFMDHFGAVEALLDAHVAPGRDFGVYFTEVGFRIPAFSPEMQALYLALYTLEIAARPRMRTILWFRYANPRPELQSGYQQTSSTGYALVGNADAYCRPAYASYRFLDWLLGPCPEVTAQGGADDRVYHLRTAEGALRAVAARSAAALAPHRGEGWTDLDHTGAPLAGDGAGLVFTVHPDHFR